jgi:maltose O-acetyltransferase
MDPLLRPPVGPHALEDLRDTAPPPSRTAAPRLAAAVEELQAYVTGFDPRLFAWSMTRWVRAFTMPRIRARVLSRVGCQIGPGTAVTGYVHLVGPRDCARGLRIGSGCILGPDVTFCLDAPITLGTNVSIGPRALLYTATHPLGVASRRMQLNLMARPIVVEDGAWIGLGAMILSGVRVGRGAVVAAGAVVNEDVPENALVAGNPATVVRELPSR